MHYAPKYSFFTLHMFSMGLMIFLKRFCEAMLHAATDNGTTV